MNGITKTISIIVAVDENWLIGKRNALPWHLPADLKHFKAITTGHAIVMGRKTFDSIGRPLPDRTNIIITRKDIAITGCTVVKSIKEALDSVPEHQDIFIIGGAEIFSQFLPFASRIYLTVIHHRFEGDIFFPKLEQSEWKEIERQDLKADDKNPYDYSFLILEKTRN